MCMHVCVHEKNVPWCRYGSESWHLPWPFFPSLVEASHSMDSLGVASSRGLCHLPGWLLLSHGKNCTHLLGASIIMSHHEQQGFWRGALNELGHWPGVICRVKTRQHFRVFSVSEAATLAVGFLPFLLSPTLWMSCTLDWSQGLKECPGYFLRNDIRGSTESYLREALGTWTTCSRYSENLSPKIKTR